MYNAESLLDVHARAHESLRRLLIVCGSLTDDELHRPLAGFGFPTVLEQLAHTIGAEVYWQRRMAAADDRVLAIMMKAPRIGCVKTRLAAAHSPERILSLYHALIQDTIGLSQRMGVRTVAICPEADEAELEACLPPGVKVVAQRGAGLAAGLRSTFEQLCTPTGDRVIAFNADSPHLPANVIETAFTALAASDLVVGPCDDGGYYLVGARRPHDGLFDAAAMGRESACSALLAAAARKGLHVALSAEHYDIDFPQDLVRLAAELARDPARAPHTARILARWESADRAGR